MGACFSQTDSRSKKSGNKKEKEFQSMQRTTTLNQKEDLIINKGDFVFQHKNTKFSDVYRLDEQVLGSGGYGQVQKCEHKTTKAIRAVKIMKKDKINKSEQTRLRYEIDILKNLDHPNILRLFEVFEDKKFIYLVTELCNGGELFDEIILRGRFEEKDAAVILKQLLSAINYCHRKNVCHRDLKPENLLLDSDDKQTIKLIDFGTSQVYENEEQMELVLGTAYYIAPEVLNGKYDEKCDIWSIGVILFILLSGEPPFPGNSDPEIIAKVKKGKYNFTRPAWRNRSNLVKQFISQMMALDPNERLTAAQALEHPWIQHKAQELMDLQSLEATTDALQNLQKFRAEQKLQQAALTFIVCQMSTKEEQDRLYKSFKAIDKNSDGKISREELIEGYKKIYKHMSEEDVIKEADKLFKIADQDGNGEIDYSEWQVATINKYDVLSEEKLRSAFNIFDKDCSGAISANEIKEILGVGRKFGNENIWSDIIKEVDTDGNGEISFEEFKIMMGKFLQGEIQKGSIIEPTQEKDNQI